MGYPRAGDRKNRKARPFPAEQSAGHEAAANDARGGASRPSGEPVRVLPLPSVQTVAGRGARRTARLEAANDPDQSTIYCRLGDVVIPTVTAFARYLKTLHGRNVAFERSAGYWLVRQFGVPAARYRVQATGQGLAFERVPFSKRQRAEIRTR